ncbi:MAG: nitrous oxide-stimulated promoter family protein [Anaerolineae bacterium]
MGRIEREKKTVAAMIRIYCRDQHGSRKALCESCYALLTYAWQRLDKCPFGEGKSTCARCLVHCYKPAMREEIRRVMRYAGPRMLYIHPILAIRHLLDERREPPAPPDRKRPGEVVTE